ncbi:hypothetical protein SEA_MOLLYMUR_87 [Gordonia phage Mollymur]|uniref:Uncharacterized protein n=1 Tax=Gordonia phage Mollymur TaxID=2590895 RepID=A0A4Y6EAK3_9CAUD|nr:hypothetical protein PQB84_gp039 [Gordonia phage Mollymur]QDF15447.1 hypothetical protein SEA_MOLLYMUR_87 [Gordonia phage Mollymur]
MSVPGSVATRPFEEVEPLARAVLAKAALLDRRMKLDIETLDDAVAAWAEILAESDVFAQEALAAVKSHYAQKGAWPIMPGDVIDYVAKLPISSSPERVTHWLRKWSYFPYSTTIQEKCGLDWTPPDPPADVAGQGSQAVRHFHIKQFQAWIGANLDEIRGRVIAAPSNGQFLGTASTKSLEG